ncbi:hypothetical protein ACPF04_06140 [Campylobacter sp. MOP51]|uniref:hypothetical protein n=1 Tax=Campylobacter canis TaxID=3378588 RepID=UPI003C631237
MLWLSQEEIDRLNKDNDELYESTFGYTPLTEQQLAKKKAKYLIEKSIMRHNAKIDKTYKKYLHTLHDHGKIVYYYPFKGLTKEEIINDDLYITLYKNKDPII